MLLNLTAIYLALQTVPFLALLAALPYTLYNYVRTKSVNVWRCTYFYSFVLYFLCAYFMTILPLPARESLQDMRPVSELIQLIPFANFASIERETLLRDVAVIVFNIVLTMPFGFYLRTLYKFDMKKTVIAGFCIALFYEISQLTGLFFIYPRPWRVFDIDDLMLNTMGAVVGYILTPTASRFLPRMNALKTLRLSQGSEVSFRQRFIAGAIDISLVLMLSVILSGLLSFLADSIITWDWYFIYLVAFAMVMVFAVIYSLLCGTNTLGNRLTGLHLTTANGQPASRLQCIVRMVLEHVCVTAIPFWVFFSMRISADAVSIKSVLWLALSTFLMLCAARNVLEMTFNAVTHGSSMFYDRVTKTHLSYNQTKHSIFGTLVLDILPLAECNIDRLSKDIHDTLTAAGFCRETVTKVRLMTEGVLLDWIQENRGGTMCELRYDKHFKQKSLILSIPVPEDKLALITPATEECFVDIFSKMTLKVESYYAAEKNVCIIHIP